MTEIGTKAPGLYSYSYVDPGPTGTPEPLTTFYQLHFLKAHLVTRRF